MSASSKIIVTLKSFKSKKAVMDGDSLGGGVSLFLYGFVVPCSLDVATRFLCFAGQCRGVITHWFGFVPFRNYHFAFSWQIPVVLMYSTYAVVLFLLIRFIARSWNSNLVSINYAWLVICAGAAVNIADRLYLGYVRDFIRIGNGYFNLGDVWIVSGVLFICIHAIREARISPMTKV